MNLRQKDYEVGYKRPPKKTQWKKAQCGNPKRQYQRPPKGTVPLIDAAFEAEIDIVEKGVSRRVSVFEAILIQLWIKEMSGEKRATAVRLKYQEFVASQAGPRPIVIEHVGNEYTERAGQRLPNKERKMNDYQVGYGKPPKHSQFKKGVCPNPHGRGKPRDLQVGEIMNKVLNAKTEFRERGKVRKASRIELTIRRLAAVASAAWLLKMRAHAEKFGDTGPIIIRVSGGPPDLFR
jgi:Family of unknown function (DUF5681)